MANSETSTVPAAPKVVLKAVVIVAVILGLVALVIGLAKVQEKPPLTSGGGFWDTIQAAGGNIAALLTPIASTILGVGTASMAFLQAAKDLFNLRTYYNRWAVQCWMRRRLGDDATTNSAICSLQQLATSGEPDALYSLEIEKLAEQMAIAGRMALDRPSNHSDFLASLLREAPEDDINKLFNGPKDASYLEAKARTATYIQRAVDGFRNATDYHYSHLNQVAVFVLNLLLFLVLWIYWSGAHEHLFSVVGAAVLSAFIAPIAKDLISGLQSLKGIRK